MGIWSRLTGSEQTRDETPQASPQVTPPVSDVLLKAIMGGETITREKAMTLPAVSGAVDFICNCVASMPVKLYKYKGETVESRDDDIRVKLLNGDTGDTLDAFQMKKAMVEDYLLGKGGYCYIERKRNDVIALRYVEERYISILKNFKPIYKDYVILVEGESHEPWEFIKLLRNTKDGASGVGVISEVSKALETAYNTLLYQLMLVKSGGNKKGFLKSTRKLGQDEIDVLKRAWSRMYANNQENVVVLNNGLEFQEASSSSVEMQLNESKKTLMAEINDLFHISDDWDMTFKTAIYPIVKAFETALNRDLLLEKEKNKYFFELDVKEIIRATLKERYEAYKLAKETGFMTLNEIRRAENMDKIDGLDVVNVGLGAVLYDTNSHTYYTPNTGSIETTAQEDSMIENHELAEAFDESGNSAERSHDAIAVDYDSTLTNGGEINLEAVEKIKELQKSNRIILWTGRTGEELDEAIEECAKHGLVFDEIAEEKPVVDSFIDDKAMSIDELDVYERFNDAHDSKSGRFTSKGGSSGGGGASGSSKLSDKEKEDKIAELEQQKSEAKGLLAKKKIQTEIDMIKDDWQGSKEDYIAHKNKQKEKAKSDAINKSKQKQSSAEKQKQLEEEQKKQIEHELKTQPKEKVEQYKIIQETNPMVDDYHVGIRKPSDIKTWDEVLEQTNGESFSWGDFTKKDAQKAKETGKITIYSSKPISQGGFVSTSKKQAEEYAGGSGNKVYTKTVPLADVAWINGDEGQLAKRSQEVNE